MLLTVHAVFIETLFMKLNEGMQGVSRMTSKEYITIKRVIKYAITWTQKAWAKLMQLGTSAISATWSHPAVINHMNVSKPEMKPCKHKYISSL